MVVVLKRGLVLIKSRGTFPWKNNERRQSLHELTDRAVGRRPRRDGWTSEGSWKGKK